MSTDDVEVRPMTPPEESLTPTTTTATAAVSSAPSRPEGTNAAYISVPATDTHVIALSADIGYWGAGPEEVQAVIRNAAQATPRYNVVLVFSLPDRRALVGYAVISGSIQPREAIARENIRNLLPSEWKEVVRVAWIKASLTQYGEIYHSQMQGWQPLGANMGSEICALIDESHRRFLPRDLRGDGPPPTFVARGGRGGYGYLERGRGGHGYGYDDRGAGPGGYYAGRGGRDYGHREGYAPRGGRGAYGNAGYGHRDGAYGSHYPPHQQPQAAPSAPYAAYGYAQQPAHGHPQPAPHLQGVPPYDPNQFPSYESYQQWAVQYQQYLAALQQHQQHYQQHHQQHQQQQQYAAYYQPQQAHH